MHDTAGSPLAGWDSFYVIIGSSAAALIGLHVVATLFVVAGAALLLLFIGIHNAWDSVTFIALENVQGRDTRDESR